MTNWVQHLKDYREFLNIGDNNYYNKRYYTSLTQENARLELESELQEVIALNGYKELYETELEYLKLLNAKE